MILLAKRNDPKPSEITSETAYLRRREILAAAGLLATGLALSTQSQAKNTSAAIKGVVKNPKFTINEELTSWADVTSYNNFYEFGLDKADPAKNAQQFIPKPWTIDIQGECEIKGRFNFEDLVKPHQQEERVYRHRCVEAWSMVVPWVGIPLAAVLKRFKPTSKAKYVAFHTLHDARRMPGQNYPSLEWPYREGLRIDEAMHPLSLLSTGVYGRELPNQNGAPLKLVLPWKYGFKGIKSIVKITFQETEPYTSWSDAIADEYGFYANVNPKVDHPRWSQATERRIAGSGFSLFKTKRVDTLMFNGYADQVASLYAGMDLKKFY